MRYARAALAQPSLFCTKSGTVIEGVETVIRRFADVPLKASDYLCAALRQAPLFTLSPETIIRHIEIIIGLHTEGVFVTPNRHATPEHIATPLTEVFQFLLTYPRLMCLEDRNLKLRKNF